MGGDAAANWWFYAARGVNVEWTPGTPILFAEVLESMMAKFLEQVKTLGFDTCQREPGTWKVTAAWSLPGSDDARSKEEPAAKRSRRDAPAAASAKAAASPQK